MNMKTAMTIGLAIAMGATAWAFDADSLNSKKALVSYGKKADKAATEEIVAEAAPAKKEMKKATVAVTHDRRISSDDRDLGKADTSSQNSKASLTRF
jgi:hypothetical protein